MHQFDSYSIAYYKVSNPDHILGTKYYSYGRKRERYMDH